MSTPPVSLTWPGKAEALRLAEEKVRSLSTLPHTSTDNVFIEADNLDALSALQESYKGMVKTIYIDPPYNTGNATFMYADKYRRKNGDEHSDWLSMMYTRLLLARPLMREDGVVFISIDDTEVAHLRLLMNEIFGEDNFIGQAIWVNRISPNDAGSNFATDHEYILIYAKDKTRIRFVGVPKDLSKYANRDGDINGEWAPDNPSAASGNDSYRFPIVNPNTGETYLPPNGRYWAFSSARINEWVQNGKLVFPTRMGKNFLLKKYRKELKSQMKPMSSVISGILTATGTKELKALFGGPSPFRFPKPVGLLKYLIEQSTGPDDIVLDFFAGSGTTAHAVMALNAEHGSNRRFICVQKREENSCNDAALRTQYPYVSDVTRARIEKVIAQYAVEGKIMNCTYHKLGQQHISSGI